MPLVWIGVLLVALKAFEVGPVATLSWWWTLAPFALAFVWFEVFEFRLGFDRQQRESSEWEERRRQRIREQLGSKAPRR